MDGKDACVSCDDDLYLFGPVSGPKQGEAYRCENENCSYEEHRYYD